MTTIQQNIQQQIDAAHAAGGGVVTLPPGIIDVERVHPSGGNTWCIMLRSNVTLRGHDNGSTLRMKPPGHAFTRILETPDMPDGEFSENIVVENLTLDGNRHELSVLEEHQAGMFLRDCKNVTVRNIRGYRTDGDIVQLYYNVEGLTFKDSICDDARRSGISLTGNGSIRNVVIDNVRFYGIGNQAIDFEPANHGPQITNVSITNCRFENEVDKTFTIAVSLGKNVTIANNSINGRVGIIYSDCVTLVGNHIYDCDHGVYLNYHSKNVSIIGNTIQTSKGECVYCRRTGDKYQEDLLVANNQMERGDEGTPMSLFGARRVSIIGNRIKGTTGISCRGTGQAGDTAMEDYLISGNYIHATDPAGNGIVWNGWHEPDQISRNLMSRGNIIKAPTPIKIDNPSTLENLVNEGNMEVAE